MKPVRLIAKLIGNSSREGEIVLDTFGGSGTTMIACEQLNRICYMMELDPHYADVIIERWEKFTGQKAIKIKEAA
jgi:DNA modification methylase